MGGPHTDLDVDPIEHSYPSVFLAAVLAKRNSDSQFYYKGVRTMSSSATSIGSPGDLPL